jgi:hypothetical protein
VTEALVRRLDVHALLEQPGAGAVIQVVEVEIFNSGGLTSG